MQGVMAAKNQGPTSRGKPGKKPPKPTRPPAGYYDPILDAQQRAAQRGYGDLQRDHEQARERGLEDFNLSSASLARGRDRTLADILTGETRTGQDKDRALADLDLQYNRLGQRQNEAARVQGVTSGGLLAKSAAIRDANETRDQQPILTSFNRRMEDFGTARTRTSEDFDFSNQALQLGYARQFGGANPLNGQQLPGDLATQLTRAGRENVEFKQDINEQRWYQARQAGFAAPKGIDPITGMPKKKNNKKPIATIGRPRVGVNFG